MHRIRLSPPWQLSSEQGRTTHARNFGRPRTLDTNERLWLVCARVPGAADVTVNGELVGTPAEAGPFAADITDRLKLRNEVAFVVDSGEALGEVWLEVRTVG
jgi:hypothetical protein